jgi:hypothetical protein
LAIFVENLGEMNIQEIITPLGQLVEDSFNGLLVPISEMFNWAVIFGGVVGLAIWLRMQSAYNKKAKDEGGLA